MVRRGAGRHRGWRSSPPAPACSSGWRGSKPLACGLLQFAGRHSLAFYLIHQPVLIGCVWLFAQIFPAATASPEVQFRQSCEAQCSDFRDEEFCTRYCVCMLDELEANGSADAVFSDEQSAADRAQLQSLRPSARERTDAIMSEGGQP